MEPAKSALDQKLAIDRDYLRVRQSCNHIMHVLSDFIPDYCRSAAFNELGTALMKSGVELTSKEERQLYEASKEFMLKTPPMILKDTD